MSKEADFVERVRRYYDALGEDDIQALLQRAGGRAIGASASNWASLGDAPALARLAADPARWERFVEHEVTACAQPGVLDGGTHILFAATANATRPGNAEGPGERQSLVDSVGRGLDR